MKKALGVFLMTAMAFGAFAEEPVADVKIAEFSGNASVEWVVDLDSGTTGFENGYEVDLKLNLLNNGTKSTTGDGVWGELVLKTEKDTYIGWENGGDSAQVGDSYISANTGMMNRENGANGANGMNLKVYVDVAKIHIGPAYIGIERDNTTTGKLKMDAAIRSADDDKAIWLNNVGPDGYLEGIVLGFENDVTKVDFDVRSKKAGDYRYTNDYALALEGELKGAGVGVDGLSVKAGVSYDVSKKTYGHTEVAEKVYSSEKTDKNAHTLGYSASVGYKLALDDTFFIRPQVGFTGQTTFANNEDAKTKTTDTKNLAVAAGLLFGWGEIGQDKDAGVYYLDDDMAKKVTPGVGVVAYIPLPNKSTQDVDGNKSSEKRYAEFARIMPSFYTGELIPGLTAAAYADIAVTKLAKNVTDSKDQVFYKAEEGKLPMAFALGAKYAIGVDEMTITPQFGLRFANSAYVSYMEKGDLEAEKGDPVFGEMGVQKGADADDAKYGLNYHGNFMNLKLGVDVAGLVDNTTLSVTWQTANILNAKDYADKTHGPKLGTLNFKAKIAL